MAKRQRRKPPKRKPVTPPIDPDLRELAEALDEFRLDRNAEGWFTLPWRDGRNAARLAADVADSILGDNFHTPLMRSAVMRSAIAYVNEHSKVYTPSNEIYWMCEELIRSLPEINGWHAARAALLCLQRWSSNSDAGGTAYNAWLRNGLGSDVTELQVIEHRCHDALGVGPQLRGDAGDKQRRAFVLAWKRGLFHAAYALPPVRPSK